MFFEDYTEKVWGVHPSKLGADWGAQRVKGLSVFAILKDMLKKKRWKKQKKKKNTICAILFMSIATLTKGPVGIVLPCAVIGIFLHFQKVSVWKAF